VDGEGMRMRLETEFLLLGWGLVGAIAVNALFSERKRPEDRQPVDFWRAMEVLGLWAAALVGLGAIYFSTRDAGEQLHTMSGQLDEMQEEGRPWVGYTGAEFIDKKYNEPLRIKITVRNFGRRPALFFRRESYGGYFPMGTGDKIDDLAGWKDPKEFHPRSSCELQSPFTTLYPGDIFASFETGVSRSQVFTDPAGNQTLFPAVFDKIIRKQALYVVYGCLTYYSGEKAEFTTFCVMLDPRTGGDNPDVTTWQFSQCPYGNDNGELEQQAEKK
jgi:hypothetical protein